MNKKLILTIGVLTVAGGILLVSKNPVMAYRGDSTEFGPNHTEERHSQMLEIFENQDFDGWKELMHGRGVTQFIDSQEEFNLFTEMRQARLNGDTEKAQELRDQLGFGSGEGKGLRQGLGQGLGRNR
jgi:hypothetical protein